MQLLISTLTYQEHLLLYNKSELYIIRARRIMAMGNIEPLIKSAGSNPLTLVAFVFFIIAGFIKSRPNLQTYFKVLIAIGVLVILLSFGLEYKKLTVNEKAIPGSADTTTTSSTSTNANTDKLEGDGDRIISDGNNNTNIVNNNGAININVGNKE